MIASDNGGGGSFEQAPEGTHLARCYKLIDLGTQVREFPGSEPKKNRQIIIGWELPGELMTTGEFAGQPFTASKFYTLSLHEKATLRGHLKNWRGRDFTTEELAGFELKNLLGKPCMLSIVLNEKGRAQVGSVLAVMKGVAVPEAVNPTVYFSLDPKEFDQSVFDSFSDKMKALITPSDEYKARSAKMEAPADVEHADDIPF